MLLFVLWIDRPCTTWSWAFAVALSEFLLLLPQDIAANIALQLIKILTIKEFTTKDKLIFPKAHRHQDQILFLFFSLPISICLENRFLFIWTNMKSTLSYRQPQRSVEQMCLCHQRFFVATLLTTNNRLKPSGTILVPVQFSCSCKETPINVQLKANWHFQPFCKFISFHGLLPLCSHWVFKARNFFASFVLYVLLLILLFQFYRTVKEGRNILFSVEED